MEELMKEQIDTSEAERGGDKPAASAVLLLQIKLDGVGEWA